MDSCLAAIEQESERAEKKYGQPRSTHESFGVLIEEMAELTEAIRANNATQIIAEAIQVASVAHRLALACARGYTEFIERSGLS